VKCNRRALGCLTALALALTGVARAQEPTPDTPPPEAVRGELSEVKKSLAAVEQELDRLRQDTSTSFRAARKSIDALQEQVARLRKEVADLRRQQPPVTRQARLAPAPAASGNIRLLNLYVEPVRIAVNGTTYALLPGEARMLRDQPPGAFTYEVVGVKGPVDRVLAANETFTIYVYPR